MKKSFPISPFMKNYKLIGKNTILTKQYSPLHLLEISISPFLENVKPPDSQKISIPTQSQAAGKILLPHKKKHKSLLLPGP